MKKRSLLQKLLLVLPVLLMSQAHAAGFKVQDAWVPEAPPVARVMAGYMTLVNDTDKEMTLISVSSPDFGKVEMHRTETVNGMSRMLKQDKVSIAHNGKVEFKPGGLHLMLMQPKHPLKKGDKITLNLEMGQQRIEVIAEVKEAGAEDHSGHEHHH